MQHNIIASSIEAHQQAVAGLAALTPVMETVATVLADLVRNDGHLFICGNGGSATESQHWSGEWRGRFMTERRPLRATTLTVDSAAITAIANDYGYEEIFARQLRALARTGDVLVAISTSGNSPNILRSLETAKELGVTTIALTGGSGGKMVTLSDHAIIVPSAITPRIQECHQLIMHTLCEMVDDAIAAPRAA